MRDDVFVNKAQSKIVGLVYISCLLLFLVSNTWSLDSIGYVPYPYKRDNFPHAVEKKKFFLFGISSILVN